MRMDSVRSIAVLGLMFAASLMPTQALAETPKRVGGHVGFVLPLVTRADGSTSTIADDFVFGIPAGVAVARFGRFVVDMEAVTSVQNQPADIGLELHPGIVAGIAPMTAAGIRAAIDVEGRSWGFTPLLNRTLYVAKRHSLFSELVVPVRFVDGVDGSRTSVGVGVHVGVGF